MAVFVIKTLLRDSDSRPRM